MKTIPVIACKHKDVTTADQDTVCIKCGVVLNDVNYEVLDSSRSKRNLYELKSIGTSNELPDTKENKDLKLYFRGNVLDSKTKKYSDHLSKFSNTCDKLGISKSQSEYAWKLFVKRMPRQSARKVAETACWAIHASCRKHGTAIQIPKIQNAIKVNFNRKKLPNMVSILYQNSEVSQDYHNDEEYYFNLNFQKIANNKVYDGVSFNDLRRKAWYFFSNVYTVGNSNDRAKQAIKKVFN